MKSVPLFNMNDIITGYLDSDECKRIFDKEVHKRLQSILEGMVKRNPISQLWDNEQLSKLVQHNGKNQHRYFIEECAELIKELMKELRGENNRDHIIEEAVDVLITTVGVLMSHEADEAEVHKLIEYKLNRGVAELDNEPQDEACDEKANEAITKEPEMNINGIIHGEPDDTNEHNLEFWVQFWDDLTKASCKCYYFPDQQSDENKTKDKPADTNPNKVHKDFEIRVYEI